MVPSALKAVILTDVGPTTRKKRLPWGENWAEAVWMMAKKANKVIMHRILDFIFFIFIRRGL
jgi:hypothetical protein